MPMNLAKLPTQTFWISHRFETEDDTLVGVYGTDCLLPQNKLFVKPMCVKRKAREDVEESALTTLSSHITWTYSNVLNPSVGKSLSMAPMERDFSLHITAPAIVFHYLLFCVYMNWWSLELHKKHSDKQVQKPASQPNGNLSKITAP